MTKVLYTAEATATGGRDAGRVRSSDGALAVDVRTPAELGGPGDGTNPEQLFAAGYAACFENSLRVAARRRKVDAGDVSVTARVSLLPTEERGFALSVALDVRSDTADGDELRELTAVAHRVCPYSNATRGNIPVELLVAGEPL